MPCENQSCDYCGKILYSWPSMRTCCGEVGHSNVCGHNGELCSDCMEENEIKAHNIRMASLEVAADD